MLCTSVGFVQAQQTAVLQGRVLDSVSKEALESVNIVALNADSSMASGVASDAKGFYKLSVPVKNLPIEASHVGYNLLIRVSYTGYTTEFHHITLEPDQIKRLNFMLTSTNLELKPLQITEDANRGSGITKISTDKLKDLVGPGDGVENLIKTLPSVSSKDELSSQYSVRGGNFDENLVYINDIEVYRPFLVRAGQQEGLSIINPDMVSSILFSAGGFDAIYGDRMSSVLDITYHTPTKFGGKVSGSLLGGSMYVEGLIKDKFSFNLGFRERSNEYILSSLQTEADYRPLFADLQTFLNYKISKKSDVSFLGIYSRNVYQMVPQSRTTDFGGAFRPMRLQIYFDGQEKDVFETLMGAATYTFRPSDETQLKLIGSAFTTYENEIYDIQGQYFLYDVEFDGLAATQPTPETGLMGVGTYLEHARNYLTAQVFNIEHRGLQLTDNGKWEWGVKYQHEYIRDKLSEWMLVDSADYTIPSHFFYPGDSINMPYPAILQDVVKSKNTVQSNRFFGYLQKKWNFDLDTNLFTLIAGIRFQYWDYNKEVLVSPRVSFSYKPNWEKDILFRLATGVYSQSPFYREYRDKQGQIHDDVMSQKSYQIVGASDWQFRMWNRPFKFVTEVYYKYLTDLIPYEIDNTRIRYSAENSAVGYATGIDIRLNGEFIEGIESWTSITLMQTQEDIEGDGLGYIPRPTDQRFMYKMFFQDYVPTLPWMRMSIAFTYASGLPFTQPEQEDYSATYRLPAYIRVDWGTSFRIKDADSKWGQGKVMKNIKSIWLYFDIFNLLNNQNKISYLWVADFDGNYYGVPNFLTSRQLNLKLTIEF